MISAEREEKFDKSENCEIVNCNSHCFLIGQKLTFDQRRSQRLYACVSGCANRPSIHCRGAGLGPHRMSNAAYALIILVSDVGKTPFCCVVQRDESKSKKISFIK